MRRWRECGLLPLPACGERVGVRGAFDTLRLVGSPPHLIHGQVTRYELPYSCGLNFVMQDALEGGVNRSLNPDSHGKSWSNLFLGLVLDGDTQVSP